MAPASPSFEGSNSIYPVEFSIETRDRIEVAYLQALSQHLPKPSYELKDENLLVTAIMKVFEVFSQQLLPIRIERRWSIEDVQAKSAQFLRRLTIRIVYEKAPSINRFWISNWDGSLSGPLQQKFRQSEEWKNFENQLRFSVTSGTLCNKDGAVRSVPGIENVERDLEERFLDRATSLVLDNRWAACRDKWLGIASRASKDRELMYTVNIFAEDYCQLLRDIVVDYCVAVGEQTQATQISASANEQTTIIDDAFIFVERFTAGEYTFPWTGTFLLLRRPTDSQRATADLQPNPAVVKGKFQRVETAWFDQQPSANGKVFARFSEETLSGPWRRQAHDIARNKLRVSVGRELRVQRDVFELKLNNTDSRSSTRQAVLDPILQKRGMSVNDWAVQSGVDFHTADNFLKGKSEPYRSTRKKLADGLGIVVEDLPQ